MTVVGSVTGWALWALFTRYMQLGLCHKSLNTPGTLRGTLCFIGVGGAFGYWMDGAEKRQRETVTALRMKLLEARNKRAQRQAEFEAKAKEAMAELEEKTRQAAQ